MRLDDKIAQIKVEIENKEGNEWLGLKNTTEQRLESLLWYLEHPKIKEFPRLLEEAVDLYFKAKESGFLKMEGIIRKLDQLNIKLGKYDYTKEKEDKEGGKEKRFLNYTKAIQELRKKIEILLQSPLGTSLPEKTQKSLITLRNYLNHPDLKSRPNLVDELYNVYETAEENDFMQMESFNQFLNKLEIKLGSLTKEMKSFKTIEEKMEELEEEKLELQQKIENLEKEKQDLKEKEREFEMEKQDLIEQQERLQVEKEEFQTERNELKDKIKTLTQKVNALQEENQGLKEKNQQLKEKREDQLKKSEKLQKLKSENKELTAKLQKLDNVVEKIETLEAENQKLKQENNQLSTGLKKLEGLIQQFEQKQQEL